MKLIRSKAPLRLGLAGGGSDVSPYCDEHGGAVLNATIGMYAHCTIEPLKEKRIEFLARDRGEEFVCGLETQLEYDGTLDLHKGAYNRIVRDFNDNKPLPVRITTWSDAPAGSGLGSSSTMMVAILSAFREWLRLPLGEYEVARMAFEIERLEVGLEGGRQDQYAATFGGVNYMEFYEQERVIVNPLRVKNWILNELEESMVLYYTGVSRDSAAIISEQIKRWKQHDTVSVDAVHQIKVDAAAMKEALLKGEIHRVAEILGRSWEAKRKMAGAISNPEIERLMERAQEAGAYSGKVSGAGGGGFIMLMTDPAKRQELISAISREGGQIMNFHFEKRGVQSWMI